MKLIRRVARVRDAGITHFRRELRREGAAWNVGCEVVDWFELAQDGVTWWVFVNTIMNIQKCLKTGKLLKIRDVFFSRNLLFHRVKTRNC